MIWVLSVLLLLRCDVLAVPIKDSWFAEVNSSKNALYETVEEVHRSIQVLYSKLQVVESQLKNGESSWDAWKECRKWVQAYWEE